MIRFQVCGFRLLTRAVLSLVAGGRDTGGQRRDTGRQL
jgi:hypothetical protein